MITTMLLTAVLRDATPSLFGYESSYEETSFDLPQALLVSGLVVLFIILTVVVFLRVRR
jgi:hypothetical protein